MSVPGDLYDLHEFVARTWGVHKVESVPRIPLASSGRVGRLLRVNCDLKSNRTFYLALSYPQVRFAYVRVLHDGAFVWPSNCLCLLVVPTVVLVSV